jgi:hypothetical protein
MVIGLDNLVYRANPLFRKSDGDVERQKSFLLFIGSLRSAEEVQHVIMGYMSKLIPVPESRRDTKGEMNRQKTPIEISGIQLFL